jgi:hypothetical protein
MKKIRRRNAAAFHFAFRIPHSAYKQCFRIQRGSSSSARSADICW